MTSPYRGKSDLITEALREMILSGELTAGTVLRQRTLAKRFSVSPTPIREAIRRLEAEGLVVTELHRGATVVRPGDENKEELYELRAAVESVAARLAAQRVTAEQLTQIRAIHREIAELPPDSDKITELNRQFHMRIYEASGSPAAIALIRLSWSMSHGGPQVVWRPHGESVAQHAHMIDALQAGDAEALAAATREHILGTLEYMHRALTESSPAR